MAILAGNMAGDKTEFALFTHKKDPTGKIVIDEKLPSKVFDTEDYSEESKNGRDVLKNLIRRFVKDYADGQDIYGACFGIAGPVYKGTAQINRQNFEAIFTEHDFRQELPYKTLPVSFINDMEAIGYGIFLGDGEEGLEAIYKGDPHRNQQPDPQDPRALMLVSEGLGQALWYWDAKKERLLPIASEGGHADFAPRTQDEWAFLFYCKQQETERPISYEYVLSIPGLVRIYKFLKSTGRHGDGLPELQKYIDEHENNQKQFIDKLIEKVVHHSDPLCQEALEMFISIWGAQAGNLALTYKAKGGVYIGGIPIPIEKLREGSFVNSFTNKEGNFRGYNEGIAIKVFKDEDIVLWGAARYAIEAGFVTKGKFAIMRSRQ